MNSVLHKADTRGIANFGWLNSRHTFSFGHYSNPSRTNFGSLRVLNDDIIAGGTGFDTHPHANMEIISIPISGALQHKDSMGTLQVIRDNEVQIMSAGTGVYHSEYNYLPDGETNFLQIWVMPKEQNIEPHYDQKKFENEDIMNKFKTVVSPEGADALWINQDAYFNLGYFAEETTTTLKLNIASQGVYFFIIEGSAQIADNQLEKRDGLGVWDIENGEINLTISPKTKILAIEVPMV